jgi:radical SAM protein with 4Fe4S-binding SPASM domain
MAERYNVRLDVTTNATLWSDAKLIKSMLPTLNTVFFSIDAPTKRTFESIRAGADFEHVISNMRLFNRLRLDHRGKRRPRFVITSILMRKNIEELPELVELAKKLGADEIRTQHVKIFNEKFKLESLLFHKELANETFNKTISKAKKLNFNVSLPPLYKTNGEAAETAGSPAPKITSRLCPYLWREALITIEGNVLPCCNAHPAVPIMGNLRKNSFLSIWNNDIYLAMRSSLSGGNPFECCKHCSFLLGQPFPEDEKSFLQYGPRNQK